MSPSTLLRGLAATALAIGVIVGGATTADAVGLAPAASSQHVERACSTPKHHRLACLAEVVVRSASAQRTAAAAPAASTTAITGLRPADIASAYALSGGTSGGLVAIVDAYDNPKLESDLAVYRKQWGLPACTTANGCFTKVNQRGSRTGLPEQDSGWGLEEALDVDAVSAACPGCKLLVVEADDPSTVSLGTAVNTAVRLGAKAVSNSYGGYEVTGVQADGKRYYTHPGVPILASTGDNGFPAASSPATYSSVIAVGGTTLTKAPTTGRGWKETAWEYGGSGCSAYIAKPSWQPASHCPMRATADVSALGDPDTGLAVYDSFDTADYTDNGWIQIGGTSLSSPLVAGMLVRSGKASLYSSAQRMYQRSASFRDIVSGSNGVCGGDSLCTAKKGWDGPTGVGAPYSLGSF